MLRILFIAIALIFLLSCNSTKPQSYDPKIPNEPVAASSSEIAPIKGATIVIIESDGTIFLKGERIGNLDETDKLETELAKIFDAKKKSKDNDATTVFVRVKSSTKYSDIQNFLDKLKKLGAAPIGLQFDDLEQ